MWNPFAPKITLTAADVITMLGQKEAELVLARMQLQQAKLFIEQLQGKQASQPNPGTAKP